ncbi:MAG: translation initiation factor IF-2 [Synechococcus sp. SB0667_bin_8]|nr:translation initiation factor IF-2 [Synechococcus sp. SB0667_bin_8]
MTKSGKVRINQLSRDLGLPAWQVVFDAAEKLSIPAKSHSSSINGEQAETIIGHLVAEGHLSEDLASAYKTRAVQKEKTVGSDKPGQAQPAPKQAKPTSKASTVRLKAKPVVTARPTPAQASSPRKPAPRPSPANQRLHRKPSQPVKEPAPGPVRLANTPTTKKDPRHPSVVKVRTKAADHPAKGKTADKEGAAAKEGLTLVKPPSGEPKVVQKPRLVRPTVVRPTAPPTAPKKPAEAPPTAGSEKAPKAKAGSARGKSPSVISKPPKASAVVNKAATKQAKGAPQTSSTSNRRPKGTTPPGKAASAPVAKQPPQLMAPPKPAATKSPVTEKPVRKSTGPTSPVSSATSSTPTPRPAKDQRLRPGGKSATVPPVRKPSPSAAPKVPSGPSRPPQPAKAMDQPLRRPGAKAPRSVVASGMPRSRSSVLAGRSDGTRSTQSTPQAQPPVKRPQIVARRPNARTENPDTPQRSGSGGVAAAPQQNRPEFVGRLQRSGAASGNPVVRDSPATGERRPKPTDLSRSSELSRPHRTAGGPPGVSRPGGPGAERPQGGLPPGVRRPAAPSEVLGKEAASRATPTASRPRHEPKTTTESPTPPRRPGPPRSGVPGGRARTAAGGRSRRQDWDDSVRLEQLRRGGAASKQRTKVHIIGIHDEDVNAGEGFASEGAAAVLSASLARPSGKPQGVTGQPAIKTRRRKKPKETARQRQRRRAMELRQVREAKQQRPEMLVVPEGNLTVQELAEALGVDSSDIIKSLFFKGISATVTQSLDLLAIEKVAEEFGVPVVEDDVEAAAKKTVAMIEDEDLENLSRRPPVVTVMGHVDHGKTSLLDAIRSTRVAAGEAGGITQHIGAYQVEVVHEEKPSLITFLDTPGHEAFTAMRARGTKVTDIAVLVVAADDGVRPQTIEAISHARAAEVPIVVAINKMDKEGANSDRVRQELADHDLTSEEWGGDTVMVPVSALKGQNIDKLLEMILLVSDVEDLQANPERLARGTVVEAHLDKAKGPVATLLVQNGTLRPGDVIAAGPVLGKIRAMVNDQGERLMEALPSAAVEALGFSEVPTAGDAFEVFEDEKAARAVVSNRVSDARTARLAQQMASRRVSLTALSDQAAEGELKELNVILKTDVQGSLEAILGSLERISQEEVQIRVLLSSPGEVTETDIDLATASGAVVIGFNTSMASGARRAAEAASVDVRNYDVIYKLLEDIQGAMEGLLEPELVEEPLGWAEVRAVFSIGNGAVAGCYVTEGKLQRNCRLRVHRGSQVVHEGDLDSLRRIKDGVKEVNAGYECGVGVSRFTSWQEGDRLEAFSMVMVRRTLNV